MNSSQIKAQLRRTRGDGEQGLYKSADESAELFQSQTSADEIEEERLWPTASTSDRGWRFT